MIMSTISSALAAIQGTARQSWAGITTVNNHLPSVWRVNYLHEAPSPEMPEIAHETARKILQMNLSRAGIWKRP
jgi:hypothetical protein